MTRVETNILIGIPCYGDIPSNLLEQYVGLPNINSDPIQVQADQITPVDQVGTGTMLIDVKVFHKMAVHHPEWRYQLYPPEIQTV